MANTPSFTRTKVLIIGGGISGICMAIELITRYGMKDLVIVEKSTGFGGTWRDNIYPGASCDVFSSLYSYSFAQKFDFTKSLPGQEEILVTEIAPIPALLLTCSRNTSQMWPRSTSCIKKSGSTAQLEP